MPKENKVFYWTRDITQDLLALYESQTLLYTAKSKDYKNKIKRVAAIDYIKMQLSAKYAECEKLSKEEITKKIHTIRTQYLKEVAQMKKYLASGANAAAYTPKLWCFDSLQFLTESDPVAPSVSNLKEAVNIESENDVSDAENTIIFNGTVEELRNQQLDECTEQTPVSRPSGSGMKRAHNDSSAITTLLSKATQSLQDFQNKRKRDEEDDLELFGRSIAVELRKIKNENTIRGLKKSIYLQILDAQ